MPKEEVSIDEYNEALDRISSLEDEIGKLEDKLGDCETAKLDAKDKYDGLVADLRALLR